MKNLPVLCPSCEATLSVTSLTCNSCETNVSGNFALPVLLQLHPEEQDFILRFILASGSLKEIAKQMKKSYPTVRNILDDILKKINTLKSNK